ncbi:MAG: PRC-barrel domain-containing protein [Kaiparowitsia implicata GSE-PSE-MK54-09C]|jgi:stress response protein YsnF|nr:PRC-barrel domain-containing protein [Kaiparowitsia implicata GSE-PSE-MK54-09C]
MVLMKIKDFDPHYEDTFGGYDIKGLSVYADIDDNKIGSVHDLLVDHEGHFRYLVVDLGFWGFGKKILLPVGRSRIDSNSERVYTVGFTKEQAERLPEFSESLKIDNAYEALVRGVYQPDHNTQPAGVGTSPNQQQPASSPPISSAPMDNAPLGNPVAQPQTEQQRYPQSTPSNPMQSQGYPSNQPPAGYPATPAPQPSTGYVQQQVPQHPPYGAQGQNPQPFAGQAPGQAPEQAPTQSYNQQPYNQQQVPRSGQPQQPNNLAYTPPNAVDPGQEPNGNDGYDYQRDPALYEMNQQNHGLLQRYEERLMQRARQSGVRR